MASTPTPGVRRERLSPSGKLARLGQVSTPVGLIIAACVIRDIALTSRWAGSRSDARAGFLRGLIWVYAGTAEPGWFVISSSGKETVDETLCLQLSTTQCSIGSACVECRQLPKRCCAHVLAVTAIQPPWSPSPGMKLSDKDKKDIENPAADD